MYRIRAVIPYLGIGSALLWTAVIIANLTAWAQHNQIDGNINTLLITTAANTSGAWTIMVCAVAIWRAAERREAVRNEQEARERLQARRDLVDLGARLAANTAAVEALNRTVERHTGQLGHNSGLIGDTKAFVEEHLGEMQTALTDTYGRLIEDAVALAASKNVTAFRRGLPG